MRGDKRAQQTLLRLRSRFGDMLLSEALDKLRTEAEIKRPRGARKRWDDFLDRYFYIHVWAITERGYGVTDAKKLFSEYADRPFGQVEKAYLRGSKHFESHTPDQKKQAWEQIYLHPKFADYLKRLPSAGNS
jgi:hypothetical protein